MLAVFNGIIVAQGAGGMFGKAVDSKALGLAGFKHFAHGVAGMGMVGMGMKINANHRSSLLVAEAGKREGEARKLAGTA